MLTNCSKLKINLTLFIICLLLAACGSGSGSNSFPGITYSAFKCPGSTNISFPGISGIREVNGSTSDVYITGGYVEYGSNHAFLYKGPIQGGGTCSKFNYPSSPGVTVTSTSLYGPDNNGVNTVVVVGSYTTLETGPINQLGLLYIGAADGSTTAGYTTLNPSSLTTDAVINTLGHSTMGGVVVGNYDTDVITGLSFIYTINDGQYYSLTRPGGSTSITVYGVWYNGGTSYTMAGGYSNANESGVNSGFITDWNSDTHQVSNFTPLNYNNLPESVVSTHFKGITTDGRGGYNLAADWQYNGQSGNTSPAFANIKRNLDGTFAIPTWTGFGYYPGSSWTSANTVYQNNILGLYQAGNPVRDFGYMAAIQ